MQGELPYTNAGPSIDCITQLCKTNVQPEHTSNDQLPPVCSVGDQLSSASCDQLPTTSGDQLPTTSGDQLPTTSSDQLPTTSSDHLSSARCINYQIMGSIQLATTSSDLTDKQLPSMCSISDELSLASNVQLSTTKFHQLSRPDSHPLPSVSSVSDQLSLANYDKLPTISSNQLRTTCSDHLSSACYTSYRVITIRSSQLVTISHDLTTDKPLTSNDRLTTTKSHQLSETDNHQLPSVPSDQLSSTLQNIQGTISRGRMKIREVYDLYKGNSVLFCQKYGLIAKKVKCQCGKAMALCSRANTGDGIRWACYNSHTFRRSIRPGSWFERSNLQIPDILYVTYMWVYSCPYQFMLHETGFGEHTIIDWCRSCREVCFKILEYNSQPLGGPGRMVEINSEFVNLKSRNGKKGNRQCLLIGTEENTNVCFVVIVSDLKKDTLLPVFKTYIKPGTSLSSDYWNDYKSLQRKGFKHLMKKYKYKFHNKKKGSHIDSIDNLWNLVKCSKSSTTGRRKEHFFEQVYRKTLFCSPDPFIHFLTDVSKLHKPTETYFKES